MKKALFSAVMLWPVLSMAQVGIGTPTPAVSAQLEVKSSTRGFLPPRVALTATNATAPVTTPVEGLLVYNTATAGSGATGVTPGFYFYSGTAWVRLIVPTDNSANVSGTVAIANGGTGQTTSNDALNALLPSQTGNAQKILRTNGTSAEWTTNVALTSAVIGSFSGGGYSGNSQDNQATGASIILPPGKWSVQINVLATGSNNPNENQATWIRMHLSDAVNGTATNDRVTGTGLQIVGNLIGPSIYTMVTGTIVINNTTAGNKTYYLVKGRQDNFPGSYSLSFSGLGNATASENTMVAYPMN